jgi:hypothetical protein
LYVLDSSASAEAVGGSGLPAGAGRGTTKKRNAAKSSMARRKFEMRQPSLNRKFNVDPGPWVFSPMPQDFTKEAEKKTERNAIRFHA